MTMKDWILVDGKRRPTRNAEGRAIHAKEAGIRAFWRWFGDSKITDEKGRPLVLYHGTPAEFDQFRVAPSGMAGAGIYFTPDPTTAGHYATTKGGIVPVYLRILRPRVFASAKEAVDAFFADLGDYSGGEADQEVMRRNIQHGYDGIIISVPRLRMRADQYPEFVVFSPNQAKSVYNRGTFDPSDPTLSNPNRSTTMTWKPYQITFKKSPRGRTLVWVRFGQRQDSALLSAKRAVREYYPKATGFTIRPYRGRLNPPQDVLANPYCTMCNPYPNEHAARIRDPKSIRPDTYRSKTIAGHGIRLIIGKLKRYPKKQPKRGAGARKADPMVVQAIRFKRTAWTPAQAKAWLREHSFKPKMFEPARGK